MYILIAILIFGFLIFIHELGHFLTAKALDVQVNEFSICMGPAIVKKQRGETLYGTLQNNTLSAGALSDLVPADVQEKYLAYIDQMIAGTFMQ